MIRLVCIDIDGTLVGSSGIVGAETWAAAERARARGIHLAVCTGRPAFGVARELATRLDPEGWHIFQNGSSVVHLPTGETRSRPFSADARRLLVTRARESGRVLELYSDDDYAVERDLPEARRHAALLEVPFVARPFDELAGAAIRGQWVVTHAEAESIMREPHGELSIATSLSPLMPESAFVNVTPPGVDKGDAISRVAAEYGIPLGEVMMVGDSENDVSAMGVSGVAVAMGNAEPSVVAVSHHRVGHVDEGGLAEALALALSL